MAPLPRQRSSREPVGTADSVLQIAWVYGFTLVFAVVALLFGLWFGVQLIRTQREGIAAINHIQAVEDAQAQQLAEMNQRLEATNDTLRYTNDRIDRLGEQVASLTRVIAAKDEPP